MEQTAKPQYLIDEENERPTFEATHGQVWNTEEVTKEFEILGFIAPVVVARRRSDNVKGTLMFQHRPRFYYAWKEDE